VASLLGAVLVMVVLVVVAVGGGWAVMRGHTTETAAATATATPEPVVSPTPTSLPTGPKSAGTAAPSTTTTTGIAVAAGQPAVPAAPVEASPTASIASMVDEVERAGVEPGPDWSWSTGDTATKCGAISSGGAATGCTYWASGVERTIFEGSPSLALVAHEVANAEAERDAVASLVSSVASAEAGTSWSPTDAVASCLVEHFMGFQDNSAGTWQCPPALATSVAAQIHQTVPVTQMTATCGMATGTSSTLSFTGSGGTLEVTEPSVGSTPRTATAGIPITVSGVGEFTAVDQGGTISQSGVCAA
jgi:hypothetical protein